MSLLCTKHQKQFKNLQGALEPSFCVSKLMIYLTYSCNHTCKHCWQGTARENTHHLTLTDIRDFLRRTNIFPESATLLGGEVMTRPVEEVAEITKYLRTFSEISLQTNLTHPRFEEYLPLMSTLKTINTSFEPGRQNLEVLRRNLHRLLNENIQPIVLCTMTEDFLKMPLSQLIDTYYRSLDESKLVFLTEKSLTLQPLYYTRVSEKMTQLYKALSLFDRLRTKLFSSRLSMTTPVECRHQRELSLFPDKTCNFGPFIANSAFRGVMDDTEIVSRLHEMHRESLVSILDSCRGCTERYSCGIRQLLGTSYPSHDTRKECLGLHSLTRFVEDYYG